MVEQLNPSTSSHHLHQFLSLSLSLFLFFSLRAATDGQDFRDTSSFYRFTADDVLDPTARKGSQPQIRAEFVAKPTQTCLTLTVSGGPSFSLTLSLSITRQVPYSREEGGYGVELIEPEKKEGESAVVVKSSSPHAKVRVYNVVSAQG